MARKRAGGRRAKKASKLAQDQQLKMTRGTPLAHYYAPLDQAGMESIHQAALQLLAELGMSGATHRVTEAALAVGCSISDDGRLLFPKAVVKNCLKQAAKSFVVHGRDRSFDFLAQNGRVNFCTGGAAVMMLDRESKTHRPSTLKDLHDLARLCDRLENIQWFARPVVATDVQDLFELDINTLYACALGTQKHIATSFSAGAHVYEAQEFLDILAGGKGAFAKRPFCTVHATTVVSPMSFAADSLDVACAAVDIGMPIHSQTGPQAGATSPATLAGTLAQVCAEGLAALCVINILKPGHPVIMGNWAFVSDLRTGAFSGGSGEQALLGAASGQMAKFYGIPGGMGAGMTDSKVPDNQAGYEKALTLTLAALSGSGFAFESAGMTASLLGCSLDAMVIDNEMLGSIHRVARGIEVNEDTLAVDVVKEAVLGAGHFLGADQTLSVMNTEYVYPDCADRLSPSDWEDAGQQDMWTRAATITDEILEGHNPVYISDAQDIEIRKKYLIHFPNRHTSSC